MHDIRGLSLRCRVVESVTLYYNETCPICRQARETLANLMAERNISFTAREVTTSVDNRDQLILTTGQIGAPAVLFDKREVVGLDGPRLRNLLGVEVGPDHPAHW